MRLCSPGRPGPRRLLAVVLAALLLSTHAPVLAIAQATPEQAPAQAAVGQGPVVGGVALETTTAAGWPLHYDREISSAVVDRVAAALEGVLVDVPRLTGLPPFATPLAVHVLADQQRFRQALADLAGVRVELVGEQIGGYAIERGGTMLLFFQSADVARPADALLSVAHELAHLAVREASQTRPVPQWFNEGYASWVSQALLRERFPDEAAALGAYDRAALASGLLTRGGLMPWSGLVTRTDFSRAGTEGFTDLEYGQSTLLVNWLAARHGAGALAEFLLAIGAGASATQAFESALGPFSLQAAAFEASVASLPAQFPPGLHPLSPNVRAGEVVYLAVVGGAPGERVGTELYIEGAAPLQRERVVDAAGLLVLRIDAALTVQPGRRLVRVTSPSLGVLEMTLLVEPSGEERPAPRPAPVQLPDRRRLSMRACEQRGLCAAA